MGLFSGISHLAGDLTGGIIGQSSAEQAAKDAQKLSAQSIAANINDFTKYFGETTADLQPYMQAGSQAIADLMDQRFGDPSIPELASFAYPNPAAPQLDPFKYAVPQTPELKQFVFDATKLGGTDAYKWRYEQGAQAVDRALAANRSLRSGNRLTALTDYGQGAASQEYENEWTRQLQTNIQNNQTASNQYNLDVNRFSNELTKNQQNNAVSQQGYQNDIARFQNALTTNQVNNQTSQAQYGMQADQYRSVMDRLFGLANQGQTAATNLAANRNYTVGGITGARGQNAANQFAASLIPVQERSQYIGGAMDLAGTIFGNRKQ